MNSAILFLAEITQSPVRVGDLLTIGGVIGGAIGAVQIMIKVGDRLWGARKEKRETSSPLELPGLPTGAAFMQAQTCGVQHQQIREMLQAQTEALRESGREQTAALRDFVEVLREKLHQDELHQQAVRSEISQITERQKEIMTKMGV